MAHSIRITNLPLEVIELIALHLVIESPFRPPTNLFNFLLLNKQIYQLLGPHKNAQLYANVFRFLFDVKALQRRLRSIPPSSDPPRPSIASPTLSNPSSSTHDHHHLHSPSTSPCDPPPERHSSFPTSHLSAARDPSHDHPSRSSEPPDLAIRTSPHTKHPQDDRQNLSRFDHNQDRHDGGRGDPDHYHYPSTHSPHQLKLTPTPPSSVSPILDRRSPKQLVRKVCNHQLASAYFERLALFRRMRSFSVHPPPTHPNPQRAMDLEPYVGRPSIPQSGNRSMESISRDLWLIYFMVLENDGQNWIQLIQAANVTGFLLNYFHYEINPSATAPGYPIERPEIAVALKLCHLFLDLQDSNPSVSDYWTSEEGIETYLFVLKPFTLASHQYDVAYAPWSIRELPIDLSSEQVLQALSHKLTHREKLTLTPIIWESSSDNPQNPLIHNHEDQVLDHLGAGPLIPINPNEPSLSIPSSKYCELTYMGKPIKILPPLHSHVALLGFFWCNIRNAGPPEMQAAVVDDQLDFFLRMMKRLIKLTSNEYDKEFIRLTSCLDPFQSQGLRFDSYQSCFEGGWDGQFGFFDLSSYRQMLFGRMESVYQGRYGHQNQVFKVREFIVRLSDGQPVRFMEGTRERALKSNEEGGRKHERVERRTNEEPTENEIEHLIEMKYLLDPSTPVEPTLVSYDPSERYELQIHGDGHSSWGHFQVKGRVRAWDGMLTFLKIYDAGRHGRWLYRGYHAPGDMIVGRWRDTLTSAAVDGYEGTFVMFKRS